MISLSDAFSSNKQSLAARLAAKVSVGQPDECWPFCGGCDVDGYGRLRNQDEEGNMRQFTAHRVAFALKEGAWPADDVCVMHSCDNPPCCNPNHLSAGDNLSNTQDCVAKGRHRYGERHGKASLTEAAVVSIKNAIRDRTYRTDKALGAAFGVSRSAIQDIRHGRKWKHIAVAIFALVFSASSADARDQRGIASWYGQVHHGRTQANGKPFNMNARTIASRTLPLGTKVVVTNLRNGRKVRATVTDRGPYVGRRVADASRRVAEDLGFRTAGLAPVRIVVR